MSNDIEDNNFNLKIFPIPVINNDIILNNDFDVELSTYTAQPLFNLGFNHFIHQSYEIFEKMLEEQGNKTFFWVVNGFELKINDNDKQYELLNNIKLYMEIDDIIDTTFIEIWEILMIYKLFNKNNKKIIINDIQNDNIKLALNCYAKKNKFSCVFDTDKKYSKTKNNLLDLGIIYIDNPSSILEIESINFTQLIIQTVTILKSIKNDGSLLIKLNDTFTLPSLKYIILLKSLFDQVSIYKPYYSRPTISDKYLVCTNLIEKSLNIISKKLDDMIENISEEINKNKFIIDIIPNIDIPKSLTIYLTYVNTLLSGIQHKEKNKILRYINSENYFGQEFQEYVSNQLKCMEYFLSHFLPIDGNDSQIIQKEFMVNINNNIESLKRFKTFRTISTKI